MPEVTAPNDSERAAAPGARAALRRELWAGLAVVLLVAGLVVGKRFLRALAARPSKQQCEELIDHQLEQASRQRHPGVDDDDIARAKQRLRHERSRGGELDRCQRRLTAAEVECGLRAPDIDELERCLQ